MGKEFTRKTFLFPHALLADSYSKPSVHGQNGAAGSQLVTIVEQSIDAAFVDEWVKDTLRARLQEHVSATADNQSLTGSH